MVWKGETFITTKYLAASSNAILSKYLLKWTLTLLIPFGKLKLKTIEIIIRVALAVAKWRLAIEN